MTTQGRAFGFGSGSGVEAINERLHGFITSEITRGIMKATSIIFGTINDGMMELLKNHLGAFSCRDCNWLVKSTYSLIQGVQGLWIPEVLWG